MQFCHITNGEAIEEIEDNNWSFEPIEETNDNIVNNGLLKSLKKPTTTQPKVIHE